MSTAFQFKHFKYSDWVCTVNGRNIKTFTYTSAAKAYADNDDAAGFLYDARDMLYEYSKLQDGQCVIAKIVGIDGLNIILRVDRDYFEVCEAAECGRRTIYSWQEACLLTGFKMYELWCNILLLQSRPKEKSRPPMVRRPRRKNAN